jgi:mRNA-degrading endonuclease RelE of RelBE toxin-antitoxin system
MDAFYTDTAKRQLKKLEHDLQERIVDKVRFYAAQPDPLEFAEPLTGHDAYRFRIGDYRVAIEVEDDTINVISIRRRDEAYR